MQNPATTTHTLISSTQVTKVGVHQIIDVNRYSNWKKLLRVTSYVLRFIGTSRKDKGLELCAEEVRSAEELWIKSIQSQSFPDELCHLMAARRLPEQGRSQPFCKEGFLMYLACPIDNRAPEALFTRGVRGHAPPENF